MATRRPPASTSSNTANTRNDDGNDSNYANGNSSDGSYVTTKNKDRFTTGLPPPAVITTAAAVAPPEDDRHLHQRLRETARHEERAQRRQQQPASPFSHSPSSSSSSSSSSSFSSAALSAASAASAASRTTASQFRGRLNGHSLLRMRQAFKRSDRDGDGNLTSREFSRVMSELGVHVHPHEVSEVSTRHGFVGDATRVGSSGGNAGIDHRKEFVNYDSFLHGLQAVERGGAATPNPAVAFSPGAPAQRPNRPQHPHQPLLSSPRSTAAVARDTAHRMFKKSGLNGRALCRALRDDDDLAMDGTVALSEFKLRLSAVGADISDDDMRILAAATLPDNPQRVDYIALSSMLESADMAVSAEAEKRIPAHEQWWRRQSTAPADAPADAPHPREKGTATDLRPGGTNVHVVYNNHPSMKKVRGLGKDRKMQRQRAAIHFQRSDVLRFDDAPSDHPAHRFHGGHFADDDDARRSEHSKGSLRRGVTTGRLVESAAQHQHRLSLLLKERAQHGAVSASMLQHSLKAVGLPVCYDDAKRLLNKIDPSGNRRQSAAGLIRALDDGSLSTAQNPDGGHTMGVSPIRLCSPRVNRRGDGVGRDPPFSSSSSSPLNSGGPSSSSALSASPMALVAHQHALPAAGVSSREHDAHIRDSQSPAPNYTTTATATPADEHGFFASSMPASLAASANPTFVSSAQLGRASADFMTGNRRRRVGVAARSGSRHNSSHMVGRELGHVIDVDAVAARQRGEDIAVGVWSESHALPSWSPESPRAARGGSGGGGGGDGGGGGGSEGNASSDRHGAVSPQAMSRRTESSVGVRGALLWDGSGHGQGNGQGTGSARSSSPKGKRQKNKIRYISGQAAGLLTTHTVDHRDVKHRRHLRAPVTVEGQRDEEHATIFTHGHGGPRVTAAQCIRGQEVASSSSPSSGAPSSPRSIHTSLGRSKTGRTAHSQSEQEAVRAAKKQFKSGLSMAGAAGVQSKQRTARERPLLSQQAHFSGFSGLAGLAPPKKLGANSSVRQSSSRHSRARAQPHQSGGSRRTFGDQLGRGVSGLHYSSSSSSPKTGAAATKSPSKVLHMKSPPPYSPAKV